MEKEKRRLKAHGDNYNRNLNEPFKDVSPDDLEFAIEEDITYGEHLEKAKAEVKFNSAIEYERNDQNLKNHKDLKK